MSIPASREYIPVRAIGNLVWRAFEESVTGASPYGCQTFGDSPSACCLRGWSRCGGGVSCQSRQVDTVDLGAINDVNISQVTNPADAAVVDRDLGNYNCRAAGKFRLLRWKLYR